MDADPKNPEQTRYVQSRTVSCDGGDGAYGHPKVYLRIVGKQIACPYCSRRFTLAPGAVDAAH